MELSKIIAKAGGPSKVAKAIGRHHTSILGWKRVPVEHVKAMETLTGIPRHILRDDVYEAPADEVAAA